MSSLLFIAILIAVAVPMIASRMLRIQQVFPLVFLQLLLGVALGQANVINLPEVAPWKKEIQQLLQSLQGLGWLGIALLIAFTGSEFGEKKEPSLVADGDAYQAKPWHFGVISVFGFCVTCAIGAGIGYLLQAWQPHLLGSKANPLVFSTAIGVCLAVTALPVLAAILQQTSLIKTQLGRLALSCAVLDDVCLWVALSAVLSFVSTNQHTSLMLFGLAGYLAAMFWAVRPLIHLFDKRYCRPHTSDGLLLAITAISISAIITDVIGLHAIVGAFVAGAVFPKKVIEEWRTVVLHVCQVLLLPFFFILTGLKLNINFGSELFWQLSFIVTAVAMLAKFGTVSMTAHCLGLPWQQSCLLGTLMQCKGLMELVAISILLDASIIHVEMFSALAMMAIISTFVTAPMIKVFSKKIVIPQLVTR